MISSKNFMREAMVKSKLSELKRRNKKILRIKLLFMMKVEIKWPNWYNLKLKLLIKM